MNSLHMNLNHTASVKFSTQKVCFVHVPETWLRDSEGIHAFKIFYGENKEAFVSCRPYKPNANKSEILINAKYAEKIGIVEAEQVVFQPITCSIPAVQELVLEPLTPDDWEVLELNAGLIEQDLMNQIRIVWPEQIFPVWAKNSSLFVRVAQTVPVTKPILLVEFTEVQVVPKNRPNSTPSTEKVPGSQTPEKKLSHHLQFQHLRNTSKSSKKELKSKDVEYFNGYSSNEDQSKSTVARAFSLISYFLPSAGEDEKQHSLDDSYGEFVPLHLEFHLHVVPYTRSSNSKPLPLVVQATTVYISASTYIGLYGDVNVPPCFVAVIQKLDLPESSRERNKNGNQSKSVKDPRVDDFEPKNWNNKSRNSPAVIDERQPAFESVCVTVMVVQSADEDEFDLPESLFYTKNCIVVHRELKRCLSLEASSLVRLVSVQSKPVPLNTIVIHPFDTLPPDVTNEILYTNFEKWTFGLSGNRRTYSFVLSDGTLLSLRLFGKKYNFFISLRETLSQTMNSSISSISSTSPNTSDYDPKKSPRIDPKYGYINYISIRDVQIAIGNLMCLSINAERPYIQKPEGLYQDIPALHLDSLGGVSKLAEQALESLEFWLKLRPISFISSHPFTFSGCMLICGPKGVGKSALANGLCKKLSKHPTNVFIKIVHCLPLRGKRVETISKKWDDILNEAVHCQPSIILFEDLDYIASCPTSHEQEVGPDGIYFANIVQTFIHLLKRVNESNGKVAVIVTSQSTHSLHPSLMNTKGRHIFQSVIEVQPPNAEQRKEILCSLVYSKPHISSKTIDSVSWKKIATKTEGYVAQDLDSLVDRATHAAWVRMVNQSSKPIITLNIEDFEMALEGYIPSSLRGIPLQVHDHKTWNDVGGLSEVKKVIQQIIMWPVKYKKIFKSYSLKPQTNILLYGAPGTGKTLLAGVIANECGLNFISIKGPELLSKYIGASEQAIRDLFKRASAARPCILFFDEFDSIAPRRGHDSTGVTDRVVNQLLTQLDGVESLEGVHVIAASSRPELIDPALLRPGRLDKCLLCPLPDEAERLEILKCLSSKLSVSDDVDLEVIASKTEYFSGADLQALLYTANIEALHDSQSTSSRRYSTSSEDLKYSIASDKLLYMPTLEDGLFIPSYDEGQKIIQEVGVIKENFCGVIERRGSRRHSTLCIVINNNHLLRVADDMKPSVSPEERKRYEAVFKNFQGALNGESTATVMENMKRVTLA
ncbi:hypothetical protein JTE90_012010 [Oedothorax gibbosus]|uniref:Peroxisomal ATPase PEX1 n=1 Tax=Oedothorax gibbosus TaxID=931172 RepID=A0AAV6UPJ3_9ARAC|nr:hypothetical protein JTE90_012010 [Oedothorax gibbosus]